MSAEQPVSQQDLAHIISLGIANAFLPFSIQLQEIENRLDVAERDIHGHISDGYRHNPVENPTSAALFIAGQPEPEPIVDKEIRADFSEVYKKFFDDPGAKAIVEPPATELAWQQVTQSHGEKAVLRAMLPHGLGMIVVVCTRTEVVQIRVEKGNERIVYKEDPS